jgi:hypothetical protein
LSVGTAGSIFGANYIGTRCLALAKHQRKAGHQSQERRSERHYHNLLVMHLSLRAMSAFSLAAERGGQQALPLDAAGWIGEAVAPRK